MSRESVVNRRGDSISKKKYITPELTEYGSVAKLTMHGGASTNSDAGNNHMMP